MTPHHPVSTTARQAVRRMRVYSDNPGPLNAQLLVEALGNLRREVTAFEHEALLAAADELPVRRMAETFGDRSHTGMRRRLSQARDTYQDTQQEEEE